MDGVIVENNSNAISFHLLYIFMLFVEHILIFACKKHAAEISPLLNTMHPNLSVSRAEAEKTHAFLSVLKIRCIDGTTKTFTS